jgi:hypothetical protein
MMTRQLLYGLNSEQSLVVLWRLLFSPSLRKHFGPESSLQWCENLIGTYVSGSHAEFSAEYNRMAAQVGVVLSGEPKPSLDSPPWAMISLDMRLGFIPWVTPIFDQCLLILFSNGTAIEKYFGELLPVAFITKGGPGNSPDTAFRICAPNNPTRASAEHWLMRAYLRRREKDLHASLLPDKHGRRFSMHLYTDQEGIEQSIFFETTESFGREQDDFLQFLLEDDKSEQAPEKQVVANMTASSKSTKLSEA